MKTDDEMIAEWLKDHTPQKFEEAEPIYTPYSGKLITTNRITKPEFCPLTKKRIYKFLSKTPLGESLDESKRYYGA